MKQVVKGFAALVCLAATGFTACAQEVKLALKGYDPVAYFTEGKPVKGDAKYSYDFDEARYHFASAKHRAMFAADPDKYSPQFGGYCTGSMSRNVVNEPEPESFVIQDGKLYLFGDMKWKPIAEADPSFIPARVPAAARNWQQKKGRS